MRKNIILLILVCISVFVLQGCEKSITINGNDTDSISSEDENTENVTPEETSDENKDDDLESDTTEETNDNEDKNESNNSGDTQIIYTDEKHKGGIELDGNTLIIEGDSDFIGNVTGHGIIELKDKSNLTGNINLSDGDINVYDSADILGNIVISDGTVNVEEQGNITGTVTATSVKTSENGNITGTVTEN